MKETIKTTYFRKNNTYEKHNDLTKSKYYVYFSPKDGNLQYYNTNNLGLNFPRGTLNSYERH